MQALLRSFDLHVLSTPPAFILSQDQTLIKNLIDSSFILVLLVRNVLICFLMKLNESTGFMVTILFSKFIIYIRLVVADFYNLTRFPYISQHFFYFLSKINAPLFNVSLYYTKLGRPTSIQYLSKVFMLFFTINNSNINLYLLQYLITIL